MLEEGDLHSGRGESSEPTNRHTNRKEKKVEEKEEGSVAKGGRSS